MPKRNKAELAEIRARLAKPIDPETEYELAKLRLAISREMLMEYETGTHGYANRVELTIGMTELTRADIRRFEEVIARYEARNASKTQR